MTLDNVYYMQFKIKQATWYKNNVQRDKKKQPIITQTRLDL